jgi:hypothetical protein
MTRPVNEIRSFLQAGKRMLNELETAVGKKTLGIMPKTGLANWSATR